MDHDQSDSGQNAELHIGAHESSNRSSPEKIERERVFREIFDSECTSIIERRKHFKRIRDTLSERSQNKRSSDQNEPPGKYDISVTNNLVGLSLSGGGIRSAAFCLGVLQGLNRAKLIPYIDYLSTVSGGGYTGTAMSVAMHGDHTRACKEQSALRPDEVAFPRFPFDEKFEADGETPHTQHIRDHSRYLLPRGIVQAPSVVAIYMRGLFASLLSVLPIVLLSAIVWLLAFPTTQALCKAKPILDEASTLFWATAFPRTAIVATIVGMALAIYASASHLLRTNQVPAARLMGRALLVLPVVGLYELQLNFLTNKFAQSQDDNCKVAATKLTVALPFSETGIFYGAIFFALLFPLATPFIRALVRFLTLGKEEYLYQRVAKILSQLTLLLLASAVPLIVWMIWFTLVYWGTVKSGQTPAYAHSSSIAQKLFAYLPTTPLPQSLEAYIILAVVVLTAWLTLDANANSLLAFYKRRLTQAFFCRDNTPFDGDVPLNSLSQFAPYHILNTTLNIPGSIEANKRGRNGDFFMFSKHYVGSEITGYIPTASLESEPISWKGGVATAMAISGAAAAPNMGFVSLRPLAFTLAMLNIRLGYWFPNPRKLNASGNAFRPSFPNAGYILKEAFSWTTDDDDFVFLSDGGHIDNLGIYELLRRRAAVIIAVDAEADPSLNFHALVQAQRFARIDQRIKIRLPWGGIKKQGSLVNRQLSENVPRAQGQGPHAALGIIEYPARSEFEATEYGAILYIKASLSGDEPDYVMDYKRRNSAFPHETTLDQFFTEEQFECYRALGFHIADRLFREDDYCIYVSPRHPDEQRALEQARKLLNGARFKRCDPD